MSTYNLIEIILRMPNDIVIPPFLGFYFTYMGIRYYKTGKLCYSKYMHYYDSFKSLANLSLLMGASSTIVALHEFVKYSSPYLQLGILIDLLWILFLICFFWWYWHTKDDPFQQFHRD
jgi:hypothetical protein